MGIAAPLYPVPTASTESFETTMPSSPETVTSFIAIGPFHIDPIRGL